MDRVQNVVGAVIHDGGGRVLLVRQAGGQQRWGLPGGTVADREDPARAVIRDVRAETGLEIRVLDLVGMYRLSGTDGASGAMLPDVLAHCFRCEMTGGEASVNQPGRIRQLGWYDPTTPPRPLTATAPVALADVVAGRSGVVRGVERH